tara:strand:- start:42 stop:413 length:372 start_codon:yes stop_codon:yes gene_type:complete
MSNEYKEFMQMVTALVKGLTDDERDNLFTQVAGESPDLVDSMDTALSGVNYDVEIKIVARWSNPATEAEQFFRDHIRLQNIEDEKLIEADVRDFLSKRDIELLEQEIFDDASEAPQEPTQAVH